MSRTPTNHILYAKESSRLPELSVACTNCRSRKLRCSREAPACQHCRKTGSDCTYDPKRSKPGIKSGAIENIHRRLDRLEDFVIDRLGDDKPDESNRQTQPGENESTPCFALSVLARELQKFNGKLAPATDDRPSKRQRVDEHVDFSQSALLDIDRRLVLALLNPNTIDVVLQTYFKHIHPWIPLVHETSLRRRLRDPRHRSKLDVLLRAIILVSTRFIQQYEAVSDICLAGLSTNQARSLVVSDSMDCLKVENIQALIGNGWGEKAWSLVGSLTRTVEYLKLTVEDEDYQGQSWVEAEERRRVFWTVFNLDRFCSVAMGWNTSLTSDDVHRRLPCDGVHWRRDKPNVTAFFGIWEKSASRMGNPITFSPGHYVSPQRTVADNAYAASPNEGYDPALSPDDPLVSAIGAFAYRIEATESLSRVTTYFLQQKVDMSRPDNVTSWLTRFKELDLRLVHWKMLLPKKWKALSPANTANTVVCPRESANQNGSLSGSGGVTGGEEDAKSQIVVMDPNLTLAHITHNASMILLHQPIAFPPHEWTFRSRLPSSCSAETCQQAAFEIATITEQYLKVSPPTFPLYPQFSFCVYVAARLLLAYETNHSIEIHPLHSRSVIDDRFWALVSSLDEMSRRWNGHGIAVLETMTFGEDLAAKYALKLREMKDMCMQDLGYRISVLDYMQDIDHSSRKTDPIMDYAVASSTINDPTRQSYQNTEARPEHKSRDGGRSIGNEQNVNRSNTEQATSVPCPSSPLELSRNPTDHYQKVYGQATYSPETDEASRDLGVISDMLLGHQFMDLDRIISFDNGMFSASPDQPW
ncbi:uncharacterized protein N7496_010631 [Penicillium cataractarum]|uniref:Zn(2)-C6 fungal-type domain-containing protein n=1 Tax=Penicillium cataractarum TaxID=2100454 RepID=A0A9W9RW49_9EURO|nr:uncharacterized protein N7496_010631 [Penicillium cataractarum]KAJ5364918.1 hypothetical protein N7496_010631 [Penicillium cataractarum]